jgi:5'-phosphate synthase pdxT subunit
MRIGVLALQGAFREHLYALGDLGMAIEAIPVRLPQQLLGLDGLIIPGGESTTIGKLAVLYGLLPALHDLARAGKPIWGTCAGLVFLARDLMGYDHQPRLGLLDMRVRRNAFGSQVDSFETPLFVPALDSVAPPEQFGQPFPGVFIRAPLIDAVGAGVKVLARLQDGSIVAAQQRALLVTAFHPELTADRRFHRYFASLLRDTSLMDVDCNAERLPDGAASPREACAPIQGTRRHA